MTLATSAPAGRLSPMLSAISAVTACSLAPSQGRLTALPPLLAEATTTRTMLAGMAKPTPLRAARAREDRGVDADQAAVEIDQRAAGIARIDGGVGLDEELVVADARLACAPAPRRCRASPSARRRTDCRWRAPRRRPASASELAKCERGKVLVRVLDAQHGEIAALVLEHDRGLELALVGERHLDLVGALDHVHVGDDEAGRDRRSRRSRASAAPGGRSRPARRRSGGRSDRRTAGCGSAPPWRRRH